MINDMGFKFEEEFVLYDKIIENLTFLHNMANGTDRISGVYDGVKFQIFFEARTWNGQYESSHHVTIFACEFYKNFKTKTISTRKKSKLQMDYFSNLEKTLLDNIELLDRF